MRIVVDGATAGNNSMGVCLEGWARGWRAVPGAEADVLHVVVPQAFADCAGLGGMPHVVVHGFGAGIRERVRAQHVLTRHVARQCAADAMLCIVPQIPIRPVDLPLVIVCHDFRHQLRPQEFSLRRRALRSVVYSHAYRHADRIATVSERTREDLGKLHPQWHAKSAAVRLGSDRPDRGASEATTERPVAIAYATHVNKRPHLVLRAWAVGVSRGDDLPPLAIVGAAPSMRDELDALRAELGLTADQVTAHGFLDDAEYDALLARARMVVLPSTFEGFGLPVIEALRLGVAVVITPEPAMREVGGPAVTVAADESAEALAGAVVDALRKDSRESRRAGIEWAAQYTWAASAAALRAELVRATSA